MQVPLRPSQRRMLDSVFAFVADGKIHAATSEFHHPNGERKSALGQELPLRSSRFAPTADVGPLAQLALNGFL
jgi:hypothetical protein